MLERGEREGKIYLVFGWTQPERGWARMLPQDAKWSGLLSPAGWSARRRPVMNLAAARDLTSRFRLRSLTSKSRF